MFLFQNSLAIPLLYTKFREITSLSAEEAGYLNRTGAELMARLSTMPATHSMIMSEEPP